jgi:uracil-DNA glycosylase family 4
MNRTKLPQLPARPDCTLCGLSTGSDCSSPGIPVTWDSESLSPGPGVPAIVCVGGSPSYEEDRFGLPWCGPAGDLLDDIYMRGIEAHTLASIYHATIVRCRTGLGDPKPSKKEISACLPHLGEDLRTIESMHPDAPLVLLICGSVAAQALVGATLHKATRQWQGRAFHITEQSICTPLPRDVSRPKSDPESPSSSPPQTSPPKPRRGRTSKPRRTRSSRSR